MANSRLVCSTGMLAAGLLLATGSTAAADPFVITTLVIDARVGMPSSVTDGRGRFTLAMDPVARIQLFSDHPITDRDVGQTLVADASSDPHFAHIAREMTNGRGNYIEWMFGPVAGGGGGAGAPSEGALFRLPPGILDFRGFALSAFTLAIDAFSSGPHPDYADFTALALRARLSVVGEGAFDPAPVPEPATLTLLGAGAVLTLARARRRRRSG